MPKQGAMGQMIHLPKDLDKPADLSGSPKIIAREKGIHDQCAKAMLYFEMSGKKFKDYLGLRTGGLDSISKLKKDQIISRCGSEVFHAVSDNLRNEKEVLTALRWHIRGLSLRDSIRKVMVDAEVSANCIR